MVTVVAQQLYVAVVTLLLYGGSCNAAAIWWQLLRSSYMVAVVTQQLYGGSCYAAAIRWQLLRCSYMVAVVTLQLYGGSCNAAAIWWQLLRSSYMVAERKGGGGSWLVRRKRPTLRQLVGSPFNLTPQPQDTVLCFSPVFTAYTEHSSSVNPRKCASSQSFFQLTVWLLLVITLIWSP